ncbi:RNA-processing protein [bacterium]|nr:MAG: RNA-processing protein [bacterium]
MIKNLKIPEERINVLKSVLKKLEVKTRTKISAEGNNIKIEGEPLDVWKTKDVVKAMGRGFSPDRAMELLKEKNILYVINLKDYGLTERGIKRVKGRLIGSGGKTREKIEEISGCMISIYGKTVSIISNSGKISTVKNAIEMLINGSKQNKVYNYLYRCFND